MERLNLLRRQFHWKLLVLRCTVNALALLVVALLVPNIYFVDRRLVVVLFAGLMLGVLNAIVKPILQFLTLGLLFASFGLVVVLINALMLVLLGVIFPGTLDVHGILPALLGGALIGILSSLLENLLGVNPPAFLLADQRDRAQLASGARQERHGVMGLLIGGGTGQPASGAALSTEVTDETIDAGQGAGKPAASAGL